MDFNKIDNKEFWAKSNCLDRLDVNIRCKKTYRTVLHVAIQYSDSLAVIFRLIQMGLKVKSKDYWGNQVLHIAAIYKNYTKLFDLLLKNGADINAKNEAGDTPLHFAARCTHNVNTIKYFYNNGADINAKNKLGYTPFHIAAGRNQNLDIFRYFNDHNDVDLGSTTNVNTTVLHEALYDRKGSDKIKLILEKNTKKDVYGYAKKYHRLEFYPVEMAAMFNPNPDILEKIIAKTQEFGMSNIFNNCYRGQTLLMIAAESNRNPKIIEKLLSYGKIDVNATYLSGEKAVDLAKENRYIFGTDEYFKLWDLTDK